MKTKMLRVLKFVALALFWIAPIIISVLVISRGAKLDPIVMPKLDRITVDMEAKVNELSMLPNVLGAGIVIADISRNERMMLMYNVHDAPTLRLLKKLVIKTGRTVPLFVIGGVNTNKILEVVGGGDVCIPFSTTIMASQMPELNEHVKTACLFGMPVIDQRFRQYFLFLLSTEVTLKDFEKHEAQIETAKQSLFLSWVQR